MSWGDFIGEFMAYKVFDKPCNKDHFLIVVDKMIGCRILSVHIDPAKKQKHVLMLPDQTRYQN